MKLQSSINLTTRISVNLRSIETQTSYNFYNKQKGENEKYFKAIDLTSDEH